MNDFTPILYSYRPVKKLNFSEKLLALSLKKSTFTQQ